MATITVKPSGLHITAAAGQTIMAAADAAGYRWPTICGGNGECLVCHVEVLEHPEHLAPADDRESQAIRSISAHRPQVRLACQAAVHGDVVVRKRGVRHRRQEPAT